MTSEPSTGDFPQIYVLSSVAAKCRFVANDEYRDSSHSAHREKISNAIDRPSIRYAITVDGHLQSCPCNVAFGAAAKSVANRGFTATGYRSRNAHIAGCGLKQIIIPDNGIVEVHADAKAGSHLRPIFCISLTLK